MASKEKELKKEHYKVKCPKCQKINWEFYTENLHDNMKCLECGNSMEYVAYLLLKGEQEYEENIKKNSKLIEDLFEEMYGGTLFTNSMKKAKIKEFGARARDEARRDFAKELVEWGEGERKNNNIYRKSSEEVNNSWLDKVEELNKS